MFAKEFIAFLTDEGFSVYPDANYEPAEIPAAKLPCLVVKGTGGFESERYIPIARPTFQVIVIGKSFKDSPANHDSAEAYAGSLIKALDRKHNFAVGGSYVYECAAMQSAPIPLGLDALYRPRFSTNFRFRLREG